MATAEPSHVRIQLPCEWLEQRNRGDGGMPVKGMRAVMMVSGASEEGCSCSGVYVHTTGAFHPYEPHKCVQVERLEERNRVADEVLQHIWSIPFADKDQVTTGDYELFFQCYMMIFSGDTSPNFASTAFEPSGGPSAIDMQVLDVARQQARRMKSLGASEKYVYARPKVVVWRDSVGVA